MPGLELDKAFEEVQEETSQEQKQEETKTEETTEEKVAEETEKEETSEEKTDSSEKKPEAEKDEFEGLEKGKDYEVLHDGRRIKKQDLINGYMAQEDYTQKTTEIAELKHQLELALASAKATKSTEKLEEQKTSLEDNIDGINKALSEMEEDDPLAKTLKGLAKQNSLIINFINKQVAANEKTDAISAQEKDIEYATKAIRQLVDKEIKSYSLPAFKDPETGEITKTKDLWEQYVMSQLERVNENLTLPQLNQLVHQLGKSAYKQLRVIISAASANKLTQTPKTQESSSKKEGKANKESVKTETKVKTEKGQSILSSLLSDAIDKVSPGND